MTKGLFSLTAYVPGISIPGKLSPDGLYLQEWLDMVVLSLWNKAVLF